jgi:hypothetical protein
VQAANPSSVGRASREAIRAQSWAVSPVVLVTLVLAACSGGGSEPTPTFYVRNVGVVVNSTAPFTSEKDFPSRVESTIDAALSYWGGTWQDLQGWTITFEDAQDVSCGNVGDAFGCADGSIRLTTRDPSFGTWDCVEQTVLVHEIGHAVIGDADHTDPRWMNFAPVLNELDGRTGYTPSGEVNCRLFPSVWQHVLGSK